MCHRGGGGQKIGSDLLRFAFNPVENFGKRLDKVVQGEQMISMATYRGRKVALNKPFLTPSGPKKRAVYVQSGGKVKIVRFGDPNMTIKKSDPARRKSFRARHNCATAKDKTTPRYWSCKQW